MTTDRIQRRIEAFLDEADAAASRGEWQAVAEKARAVLAIDPDNQDAPALLRAALANLDGAASSEASWTPPAPAPAATAQPTSFAGGRYEVRRFLGEGGKKRVFLAHDTRLDRDVAFALIKTDGLDEVGRERIVREAQAMGRLGAHPHIVTIFEIGEEAGSPYVVNELLAGGDVEGELEKAGGPLGLARALEIAKGVARGLAFAHERGIVHRDLKPGNVWLTAEGTAKIGDFGLAVSLDRSRLTQHGMMVGTVAYMPPEQALGGEVTPQADLYSLGAMLYELVTGRPPFQADDPTAVISQHINTPPVAPSWHSEHCPPDLEALILRLLSKVPADRPASASEVLAALEAVDPNARSASHSDSSANPLDRLARGVFVGRERELERLRAAFDDAFAGRGSVVMLVGEPGIGKTRTVQELSTYARMRGAKVLWGRAYEASGAPAYWPWTQAARDYRAQTPDDVRRRQYEPYAVELQRIFPNLRTLFPGLPEPPPVDSEEGQFQLFDALTSFLRDVTVETPLVVVLDDLHWADRSTLRMLTHLAREIAMARLLVVGTYRDTDLDRQHPLSQALAEMNREQLFTRVLLRGLAEPETRAYIEASAHVTPSADLVRRIHQETEGNPFFLSEVVRLMAEEGSLAKDSLSGIAIPEGVKEALGRRLDRLSPEANELLSVAAVVGRECTHQLLAALTDFDDDTLLRLVEEALAARVLEETGVPGEYRFTHALMQDALYAELSTARRVRMHARVAEALEAMENVDLAVAASLAIHYAEASVIAPSIAEKAVHFGMAAAQQAESVAAWEDAQRHDEQCLTILDGSADGRLPALLHALGRVAQRAADWRTAWRSLMRSLDLYRAGGDAVEFARVSLDVMRTPTSLPRLVALRDEALAAGATLPSDLEARLQVSLETPLDERTTQRVREIAHEHGLADVEVGLNRAELNRALAEGREDDVARLAEQIVAQHKVAGNEIEAARARQAIARVAMRRGELDRFVSASREFVSAVSALHLRGDIGTGVQFIASVHLIRGEFEEFEEVIAMLPGENFNSALYPAMRAQISGDLTAAVALLPEKSVAGGQPGFASIVHGHRCRVLVSAGQIDSARLEFMAWREVVAGTPDGYGFRDGPQDCACFGETLRLFASDETARRLYERLQARPSVRFDTFGVSGLDRVRGYLAQRLGLLPEAESHFRAGLDWAERERSALEAGHNLQGLADVAEARGDHAHALEHLDAAAAKFAQYGAKLYLDQVLAKKELLRA